MFVNFNILNQLGSPAINSNTFANRPAAGQTGRLFVSTDTFEIYRDNGTTWDLIGGPGSSTITGTGTATQVAYFTSSQAIGSSANLYWDNTNTRLGVGTATPGYTIEANGAVKADRIYLTGATAFNGALYWTSDRVTLANYNVGGVVHIETNGGLTAAIFDADLTATFANGIGTRGYTGSTSYGALFNGSVGINTATPGVSLDVHGTGTLQQLNTTGATANNYLAFQRTGATTFSIGDTYNGGSNYFRIFGSALSADIVRIFAATGESFFTSTETYSSGNSIGVSVQNNLTIPNGVNVGLAALGGVNSNLNLTLGGSTTVANTGRQGLEGSTTINFTGAGTLTMTQGTTVRAFSALSSVYAFNGSAVGTITHLAGLRICFPDNIGSAVNITNNYALLINNQTTGTGTVTYTNRWGIYQEGSSDLNYFAANTLINTTVNNGEKLQVNGAIFSSSNTVLTNTKGAIFDFNDGQDAGRILAYKSTGSNLLFYTNPNGGSLNLAATIDPNGNFGVGVTPANFTTYRAFQIGRGSLLGASNDINIAVNGYFDSGWKYLATDSVGLYNISGGIHSWYNAPSGTAGNAITYTQAMTLTSGGNLLIGTTTDAGQKLQVNGNQYTNGVVLVNQTSQGAGGSIAVNGSISICNSSTGVQSTMAKDATQITTSITNSAVTIFTTFTQGLSTAACGYFIIYGSNNAGNSFLDVVTCIGSQTPVVISSSTVEGTPAARTYTTSTNNLRLSIASGTYNVLVKCTTIGYPF